MSNKNNDAVGYKHPPKNTRFQPGSSGNPRGRPKAVPSLVELMFDELRELVRFRDDDGTQEISNARAICRSLVRDARAGNLRAANLVLTFCAKAVSDAGETQRQTATADDMSILNDYINRELRRRACEDNVAGQTSGASSPTKDTQQPDHGVTIEAPNVQEIEK